AREPCLRRHSEADAANHGWSHRGTPLSRQGMCARHGLLIAAHGTGAGKDSERSAQIAQGRVNTSDRRLAGSLHSSLPLGHGCAGRGAEANQGLATDWGTMRIQARNHIRKVPCKSVASYLRFLLAPNLENKSASAARSRFSVIAVSGL